MENTEIKIESAKIAKDIAIELLKKEYVTEHNIEFIGDTANGIFNYIFQNVYEILKK